MNDLKGIIEDCNKSDLVSDKIIKKVIEIIGQEEWQILHDENNDICTTMGELIITLKGIADLEKENAELKEINTHTLSQLNLDNGELIIELTKAKEIIKGWLGDFYNPKAFYQQRAELVEQSEKFIKDSEVEK